MHAQVRDALQRRENWNYEAWDLPINQVQLAGTLMLFSLVFTVGLNVLGFQFSRKERRAIFHLWRYVGWLLGIDHELLPADEADTWRLTWLEAATEFIPDEDAPRLAAALIKSTPGLHGLDGDGPLSKIAARCVVNLHASYSRLALGKQNADHLGLPNSPLAMVAVVSFSALIFVIETFRRLIPGATRLSELVGDRSRRAVLSRLGSGKQTDLKYTTHDAFE
jgi:hypothetical protein